MRLLCATLALVPFAAPAVADTIYPISGEPIEDCSISEESVSQVTYEDSRGRVQTIATEEVLSVEYERYPVKVDQAEAAVLDGDLYGATELLLEYVEDIEGGKSEKRYPWAPAYATNRLLEINLSLGELDDALDAANRLIKSFPQSRFVTRAYLVKADLQSARGKNADATKTIAEFRELIQERNLSPRWSFECDLVEVQTDDSLSPADRRKKLESVIERAGSTHPIVRNRARVGVGESYIAESMLDEAQAMFESILDDPRADDETLAGAHAGLGDCLYQRGADAKDEALLSDARRHFMRVVVLYEDYTRYVSKSMFYAGRCFQILGQRDHAVQLYRAIQRDFPQSSWAKEAENFLRG